MVDLKQEVEEFRKIGHEFLEKKLTVPQFKHVSGGFGVYAQRGGERFMIRLRIPSGVLTKDAFCLVYEFATRYHLTQIHFTTRQTIQLHDLEFDAVCDIMKEAMDHGIYTRGGGGDYPRNVALSPLSGVAKNEAFDPTPFALLVNDHFMKKITTYHLPRKLKVAFSNNYEDTANCTVTDLGFMAVLKEGKPYFKVYIGGGLGNNPSKAIEMEEYVEPSEVLYYVEAMTRLFIEHGNYENRAKARIRYIAKAMGEEEFLALYKKYVKEIKEEGKLEEKQVQEVNLEYERESDGMITANLYEQKQEGRYTVKVHPFNGQLKIEEVKKLIEYLDTFSNEELRISMDENLYVRQLTKEQSDELLALIAPYNGLDPFEQMVACVGVPTCQIGIANTQRAAKLIYEAVKKAAIKTEHLPKIRISGCNNSCSRQQVGEIGLAGRMKKVGDQLEEVFELYIGGDLGEDITSLGDSYGVIPTNQLPEFFCELGKLLEQANMDFYYYFHKEKETVVTLIQKYIV